MSVKRKSKVSCRPPLHPLTKNPYSPTYPPPDFLWNSKKMEVLVLLSKGHNLTSIARHLKVSKPTTREKLIALQKWGLVDNSFYHWSITDLGTKYLQKQQKKSKGGSKVPLQKSVHSNEFSAKILDFPGKWNLGHQFLQCLRANEIIHNKSTGQWYIYFDKCTIRISPTKKKISFFIIEHVGTSFEDVQNEVFDSFVEFYRLIESKGFRLSETIESRDAEFANKDGFFAKLADYSTKQGFRIDTEDKSFWVDYSEEEVEEETDNYDNALRMEKLSESALNSSSDFVDLDKLIKITSNLVKIETIRATKEHIKDTHENGIDREERPQYIG